MNKKLTEHEEELVALITNRILEHLEEYAPDKFATTGDLLITFDVEDKWRLEKLAQYLNK